MKHLIWLLLALALVLTACPDPPSTTLTINTPNSQVMISDSVVFTVSDATGKTINNTDVQWISTDPKIVTINANGVATGLTVGSTTISASRGKNKSTLFKLSVAQIKKGVVNVFSPTLQNPGRVLSLPVVQYQDYALYQQDIAFPLENTGASLQTRGNVMASFNGIFVKRLPWANRTLPYYLNPSLPQEIKNLVSQTAVLYKQRADINLVQLSSEPSTFIDHVYIDLTMKPNICGDSMVGRKGGRQVIHFALGCQLHSYIHEFGHALGLWHEQTRSDTPKIRCFHHLINWDW